MSAQTTPIGMDLSPEAEKRNEMVIQCWDRLQHFAYRAMMVHGKRNDEMVVVCIKVDSHWRFLVDILMPNATEAQWQSIRDQGQEPVACGTASFGTCHLLATKLPDIAHILLEVPEPGKMKCIALDDGGCTVYDIKPVEMKQ